MCLIYEDESSRETQSRHPATEMKGRLMIMLWRIGNGS